MTRPGTEGEKLVVPRSADVPAWLKETLGLGKWPAEGEACTVGGVEMVMRGGILRSASLVSEAQKQTEETFGFKWHRRDTFEREESLARVQAWLLERYGIRDMEAWLKQYSEPPLLLDAGCGAGMSALELFGSCLNRVRYLGVDISAAVEVAAARFSEKGFSAGFMQTDLCRLPLPPRSVDIIFSEGVLHHTDSTRSTFEALVPLLKPGGRFMLYVYRKKGPVREFTDDYIRSRLQSMTPEEAWRAVMPLTKLGKQLGELNVEIDLPEPIELLQIPAGRVNLQRFVYWHLFKAFYRPELTLDELNHINFDWFAPRNAHRHTPEEIREWCAQTGLSIEREVVEEAGITVIARRESSASLASGVKL